MSLTVASSFAEKIRNISTAIVGCVTLFGFMMVPVGYYARAEMKEYVEGFFEEKIDVGFKKFRDDQRKWNRDYENKLKDYNYNFQRRLDLFEERQKNRDDKLIEELRRLNRGNPRPQ